jgi:hypothetical protein
LVGVAVGMVVTVGVGDSVGVGVGLAVSVGEGVDDGVGDGVAVGVAVDEGVVVGVAVGGGAMVDVGDGESCSVCESAAGSATTAAGGSRSTDPPQDTPLLSRDSDTRTESQRCLCRLSWCTRLPMIDDLGPAPSSSPGSAGGETSMVWPDERVMEPGAALRPSPSGA